MNLSHGENSIVQLEMKNVHLSFSGADSRVDVLKGVDLKVLKGQTIAVIGPSGSGKTSLLMAAAGVENVDSGEISVAGKDLLKMNEDALARFRGENIGIVFQFFHLIPTMTALENVAIPLELARCKDAFAIARRELEAVGLSTRERHYPGQLSGGEQQRVAIARALAPEPAILLADEPTGNLDSETGERIKNLIFDLQKARGMTLLLVTHDPTLARRCARVVSVEAGRVKEENVASYARSL